MRGKTNFGNLRKLILSFTFAFIMFGTVWAQQKQISGHVKDDTNLPVVGATVLVKGTTIGTVTDYDGNYKLEIPSDAKTIVFSYIGMKPSEVAVKGSIINCLLEEDSKALEEVVVVGYGTVKRKDLTGSVASVSADALAAVPVASAAEALTGKMAGVQITTTEGSPDAEMKIRVRGGGSITGDNTPLFIVDGFPVESISDIAPSDIESIDVLKDASSTAIYGSRGANGVIIVTTKSGKEGKVSVNYNAYVGWKKISNNLDVLGVQDYLAWQYERALLSGNASDYEKIFGSYNDRDMFGTTGNNWQDQMFGRTGQTFNQNLNINGGGKTTKYSFNYSHMYDKALIENSKYKLDNLRLQFKN